MGKFTETIEQYKNDQQTISSAINEKLGGGNTLYKFSEVADKIREIETSNKFTLRLVFDYNENYAYRLQFKLCENTKDGNVLLDIDENYDSSHHLTTLEYTFSTTADTLIIPSGGYFCPIDDMAVEINTWLDITITGFQGHKTITLSNIAVSGNAEISIV